MGSTWRAETNSTIRPEHFRASKPIEGRYRSNKEHTVSKNKGNAPGTWPPPIPEASPRQPPPTALDDEIRSKTCAREWHLRGNEGYDGLITAGYRVLIVVVTLRQRAKTIAKLKRLIGGRNIAITLVDVVESFRSVFRRGYLV